jgi:sugar phosphate isomerase/epimerase
MATPLAGHTNSYHTYSHDEALQGIAEAGYRAVELSAVPGWTEHVDLDADPSELRSKLAHYGLEPVSLSAHSDLTTADGLAHGIKAVRWAADYGIPIVNTAVGGHQSADENEAAFLANIGAMADEADRAGIKIGLEIHGDIMASGAITLPLLEKIGRDCVGINYDTANVIYYSGDTPVEDIPKVADKLVHVHLKESKGGKGVWNFGEIGTGDVDWAEVIRLLRASGYDAPYSVEIEFDGGDWPPLEEVNEAMRRSREYLASVGLE